MATKIDENVFSSPWNDSDLVLVVEDQELHVHRSILTLLSPVFKAMLDGHFKEASEDKITLEGKSLKSMVLFLKVLYPSSMFEESKSPLNDATRLSVMALADEYQCVNLVKQCINEAEITPGNVLQILPYVVKYHQTALPRMYDVINWGAPTLKLEEVLPTLENNEIFIKMLLNKCRFLESRIVDMHHALLSLTSACLAEIKKSGGVNKPGSAGKFSLRYAQTNASDSRCGHVIKFREINKAKNCSHCKEKYKEKFLAPIPCCRGTTHYYFDMFQKGNDVVTALQQCRSLQLEILEPALDTCFVFGRGFLD